ncbi:MAG: hypothetical protein JWR23_801 [Mucilaginibacter sp.]|nr:hypothetical protein [Mucilaginibacter sp.]
MNYIDKKNYINFCLACRDRHATARNDVRVSYLNKEELGIILVVIDQNIFSHYHGYTNVFFLHVVDNAF